MILFWPNILLTNAALERTFHRIATLRCTKSTLNPDVPIIVLPLQPCTIFISM